MTNSFYNPTGTPGTSAPGNSAPIRNEFAAISAAFDFFPALAGNGGRALVVNGPGTALALTSGKLALAGDLTFLGTTPTTFSSVAGVTLTLPSANGTLMTFGGGTMTGILNLFTGSTVPTPAAGTNNTQIASTAFVSSAVSTTSSSDRAYTDTKVSANSTADQAYTDTKVAANSTSDRAYTDTAVATNSTGDRAYTDTKVATNSTGDRAYTDSAVATNSTGDRAYTDTKVAANSTSDRAYTDTAVSANSTSDRAYADGKFLPLTGGNVNGSITASGTLTGNTVKATASGNGSATLQHGSDATHVGFIEFIKPDGNRAGYIGSGTAVNRINMVGNENGYLGWDMTGSLNVTGTIVTNGAVSATNTIFLTASGANDAFYYADGGSGHNRGLMMRTSGANRWLVAAESTAEGTASVGSNFGIYRYQDGAPNTPIGAMNIRRDSGDVRFAGAVIVDTTQSGDDFQFWSTAVPPFARTISFTTTGWSLQFDGQLSDLNFWPTTGIGGAPYFTSQGTSGNFIVRGNVIGNNISAPSDERVKRDIEPYTRGLDDLIRLNPVTYSYNGLGGTTDDGTRRVGLGARASRDIVPECVFPTPEVSGRRWNRDGSFDEGVDPRLPDQLSLDDKPLIFALINAVKTLSERLHQLEQRKH